MRLTFTVLLALVAMSVLSQDVDRNVKSRVTSIVDSSVANNMVLIQTFEVNTSIGEVWEAFTTKKGWESWSVPVAEVDFRINGLIQTNYNKDAKIGDPKTIRLHVLNYVPHRLITLQAELTANFPEFMKEDAQDLYNVILFEEVNSQKTRIISHGIGYKNTQKYRDLLKFFITGNESTYLQLISYLENDEPVKF